ncbi:MAG: hypothetical protein ACM3TN_06895 [Alphaproteobacteria bacterium]
MPDGKYPRHWGDLAALGPECKSLEGSYLNEGLITGVNGTTQPVLLTSVLNVPSETMTVSLTIRTRRLDQNGDAFVTLGVIPDNNPVATHEVEGCFCIKQTLASTQVSESYWSVPNFGLGGLQKNVYFSMSHDGSLIAKLQNYHADVILAVPMFGINEPWARFENADQ